MTERKMDERIARHFDGYPIVVPIAVAWGEMDAFGHVNNAVYFRYFEIGRIAYLTEMAFGDMIREDGLGPILHSTQARFRIPVRHPDTVWSGVRVTEVLEDRLVMEHRLVSEKAEAVAAEGSAVVVSFDYRNRRKAPLPPEMRAAIARLQGEG